jgi:hypothetical protein
MRVCSLCGKVNPDDADYCNKCGNTMAFSLPEKKSWIRRIPSWAWILIIVGGIVGLIAFFIGSFFALTTIEGIASAVLLIAGMIGFGVTPLRRPENTAGFARAIGLSFFALMGASVDQTGNYLYNLPVEMSLCPEATSLSRQENISNPLPGTTYVQQDFTCYDDNGEPVKKLNEFAVLGVRFLEYVFLGYFLIGLRRLIWRLRYGRE